MNKLLQYINSKEFNSTCNILWAIIIPFWIVLILYGQDIKDWRIKSFQEQQKQKEKEPPLIICSFCKGTGERHTDVNKLMIDASFALFINHHLNVDKCNKCVKLPNSDSYEYCGTVEAKHQSLLKEYAIAGPKIDIASCEKCMGMGTFSSKDLSTGKWITQKEYDKENSINNEH